MLLKIFKPLTPSLRHTKLLKNLNLAINNPEKSLLKKYIPKTGRNNQGIITSRHKTGGHKKRYRIIDFTFKNYNIPGIVINLEYDPLRTANIALIHYIDGTKGYILAPEFLMKKMILFKSYNVGTSFFLFQIPVGSEIYNIEFIPGNGGKIARAAGTSAKLLLKEKNHVIILLNSTELRIFSNKCKAILGKVSNSQYKNINYGKAGRKHWLGIRSKVRGSAMNAVDHPHGGGEGKSSIGLIQPRTPWSKIALGMKTRKKNKKSNKFILKSRHEKKI
uniref:Ribosomal protein L2 n=1 Tax=Spumella sp. NIES-1846 TaxID=2490549 RepID=A0A455RGI1_9STRA|nr:ribosomal protein L2 [Spumella sp. NIES-1846]